MGAALLHWHEKMKVAYMRPVGRGCWNEGVMRGFATIVQRVTSKC